MIDTFLLTYNCNKRHFDKDNFIPKLLDALPEEVPMIFVFGVEEMCSIYEGCFKEMASRHLISLNEIMLDTLKGKYGQGFQTIGMSHIGAIGIVAITPYPSYFEHVQQASAGIGMFNSSMKGGVGLRMNYVNGDEKTQLTFVNAHLSAYEGEMYYLRRNAQVYTLLRSLHFEDNYGILKPNSHTFFMGDLNYRTSKSYTYEKSRKIFEMHNQPENIQKLLAEYDELTYARKRGDTFIGFSEAKIEFPPTYKYKLGTLNLNTKRSPSWCDRILYQSTYQDEDFAFLDMKKKKTEHNKAQPIIHKYGSFKPVLSDHHPVYLYLSLPIDAPESLVSSSGYLQIPATANLITHEHSSNCNEQLEMSDGVTSGPTQIYVKSTQYDDFIQTYIVALSDFTIGWLLWFVTIPKGRISLALILLMIGTKFYLQHF